MQTRRYVAAGLIALLSINDWAQANSLAVHTADNAWPRLTIYGTNYASACAPRQWKKIYSNILALAGQRNPEELTRLIRVFFCGNGRSAEQDLKSHVARKVKFMNEETGDSQAYQSFRYPGDYKPMTGNIWDASVSADGEYITIGYWPNEFCSNGDRLRFKKNHWQIFESVEGCD
jgi:hypothetical protein